MKAVVFLLSYLVAVLSLFIPEQSYLSYLFALFIYLAITNRIDLSFHRYIVIHPLVLGFSFVLLYSLLETLGDMPFATYIIMIAFLNVYQRIKGFTAKVSKQKEKIDTHFYVKRLVLPAVYPIATFFVFFFLLGDRAPASIYWMVYFLIVVYFSIHIVTPFYASYFTVVQVASLFYVFQFMDNMEWSQKGFLLLFVCMLALSQYLYSRGGKVLVPFIQALLRKKIPQPQDGTWVHKRR